MRINDLGRRIGLGLVGSDHAASDQFDWSSPEAVTVQLDQVGGSGVRGTATLSAAGEGTQVVLEVEGLAPGTTARATMHANSCNEPSASFAALPKLTANAGGKARATGSILYRDTEAGALATMADGAHIIAIQRGRMVACGVIPRKQP